MFLSERGLPLSLEPGQLRAAGQRRAGSGPRSGRGAWARVTRAADPVVPSERGRARRSRSRPAAGTAG